MKDLTVKNMKAAIINYAKSNADIEEFLQNFYKMVRLGFISDEDMAQLMSDTAMWMFEKGNNYITDHQTGKPVTA